MKNLFLRLLIVVLSFVLLTSVTPPARRTFQYNYENVLGTSLELKVISESEKTADLAEREALDEIDRLNLLLSTYDANSEIGKWVKTYQTEEKVSPELLEIFMLFDHWREKTNGALNASAAIALEIWQNAASKQQVPGSMELANAAAAMRPLPWRLNIEKQAATHLSKQPLVLNSFVKSYIIRKASLKVMSIPGVIGAVINIGGDIMVSGDLEEKIFVADPLADAENDQPAAILKLKNKFVATSGNYRRGYRIGDKWFSHIIDARTAMPVSDIISATVVAGDAVNAGALATAFTILTTRESVAIAETIPDVEYLIITRTGEKIFSKAWIKYALTNDAQAAGKTSSTNQEKPEVSISLELARFEGRSHRPFVAIWVEDRKKEPVRTVSVWFNKPRWLPDLRKWFDKNQSVTQDYVAMGSVSSATRSAGKYTVVWDGLDDKGKEVPSGTYTVYIEAAREHGTHQLIKQEIDWKGKPGHFDLEGGIEITSASIDVHVKTGN